MVSHFIDTIFKRSFSGTYLSNRIHHFLRTQSLCTSKTIPTDTYETDEFDFGFSADEIPSFVEKGLINVRRYKMLIEEHEVLHQRGKQVPSVLTEDHLIELSKHETFKDRLQYYKFLVLAERRKVLDGKVKSMKRQLRQERIPLQQCLKTDQFSTDQMQPYALSFNTIFHRLYKGRLRKLSEYRAAMAQILGPHLVIDCSYENVMFSRELHHCYTQLLSCWNINRRSYDPFNLIYCNVSSNSQVINKIKKITPVTHDPMKFFNCTDKHYLELFPADDLIYLSPHSENELTGYDGRYTYIIGAFVDEVEGEPLSMQKAERDGLKTAKFPIDKFINFCQGSPRLPMNQCVSILSDLKKGESWEMAFSHVGQRKLTCSPFNSEPETKDELLSNKHLWAHFDRENRKTKRVIEKLEKKKNKRSQLLKEIKCDICETNSS